MGLTSKMRGFAWEIRVTAPNLFKEYALGQKDMKRMGKWIRQRVFSIAGKLIKSGRKFILKLQEDWAYKEEYNEAGRRLGAIVWVT